MLHQFTVEKIMKFYRFLTEILCRVRERYSERSQTLSSIHPEMSKHFPTKRISQQLYEYFARYEKHIQKIIRS